jgi:hypothetical protein
MRHTFLCFALRMFLWTMSAMGVAFIAEQITGLPPRWALLVGLAVLIVLTQAGEALELDQFNWWG